MQLRLNSGGKDSVSKLLDRTKNSVTANIVRSSIQVIHIINGVFFKNQLSDLNMNIKHMFSDLNWQNNGIFMYREWKPCSATSNGRD